MAIISESTYEDFTLLSTKEVVKDYSCISDNTCPFEIPVFCDPTDVTSANKYKNDFTAPLFMGGNRYSNPKFYLERLDNCVWTEISQLNTTTYGTLKNDFVNTSWLGYTLLWYKVYNVDGEGIYRIRLEYTDIVDATVKVEYSYRYNLKLFSANLADKTTKIEYRINGGKIGSETSQEDVIDYNINQWSREIRLPASFFGFESSEYSEEFTRFKNGAQVWIQNEQTETILFNAKRLPYTIHRHLKITALMSDEIYIYDYNLDNPKEDMYDRFRVVKSSNYEPKWNRTTPYASIELSFKPYYENLRRKRC